MVAPETTALAFAASVPEGGEMTGGRAPFHIDHRRVANALSGLVRRTNDDCFVIFSDRKTEKFIQFNHHGGMIHLDLPTNMLDELEIARAAIYFFTKLGIRPERTRRYLKNQELPWDGHIEFSADVGRNVQVVADMVVEFFAEICDLSEPIDLIIQEN